MHYSPIARLAATAAVALLIAGCGSDTTNHPDDDDGNDRPASAGWTSITTGYYQACGVHAPGTLWCWEPNAYGAGEPDGQASGPYTPVQVGSEDNWTQVSTSFYSTCGIRDDNTLWCWGSNANLGIGVGNADDEADYERPTQVGADDAWASVEVGEYATCAITTAGELWCWGSNYYSSVGDGTFTDVLFPIQVGTGTTWEQVSSGASRTCALDGDHTLWCWGGDSADEATEPQHPEQVGDPTIEWESIRVGGSLVCGLDTSGRIHCDIFPDPDSDEHVTIPENASYTTFGLGESLCAVEEGTQLVCLGANDFGQLGTHEVDESLEFVAVEATPGGGGWRDVSVGDGYNCAIDDAGDAWCWGATSRSHNESTDPLIDPAVPQQIEPGAS
ncbi:RCC1 domain-containing protein [Nocardioides pelophilus]|uniref:RCC1 domain-containing protein n=1 Tax=Nocardioides pelophilus TaxID=2172019 RepID=UPI001600AF24|nr:hypothetical protein [Nocardioides pelophilus]